MQEMSRLPLRILIEGQRPAEHRELAPHRRGPLERGDALGGGELPDLGRGFRRDGEGNRRLGARGRGIAAAAGEPQRGGCAECAGQGACPHVNSSQLVSGLRFCTGAGKPCRWAEGRQSAMSGWPRGVTSPATQVEGASLVPDAGPHGAPTFATVRSRGAAANACIGSLTFPGPRAQFAGARHQAKRWRSSRRHSLALGSHSSSSQRTLTQTSLGPGPARPLARRVPRPCASGVHSDEPPLRPCRALALRLVREPTATLRRGILLHEPYAHCRSRGPPTPRRARRRVL